MSEPSNPKDGKTNPKSNRIGVKKPGRGKKAKVNTDLAGFEIGINAFGEIKSNFPVERINAFLNTHVADRRLHGSDPDEAEDSSQDAAPNAKQHGQDG